MNDLIRARFAETASARRANALLTNEDDMEESFDEEVDDIEKTDDGEGGDDVDISNWEN